MKVPVVISTFILVCFLFSGTCEAFLDRSQGSQQVRYSSPDFERDGSYFNMLQAPVL